MLSLDRHSLFLTRNRFITCTLTVMGRFKIFANRSLENLEFCPYHKFMNVIFISIIRSFVCHLLKTYRIRQAGKSRVGYKTYEGVALCSFRWLHHRQSLSQLILCLSAKSKVDPNLLGLSLCTSLN